MDEARGLLVRQATHALLAGRFGECERLAARAAAVARPDDIGPGLLAVAACREQGRAAEAEILLRDLLCEHPSDAEGRALLAAVLADLGRDADAGRELDTVDLDAVHLDAGALAVYALAAEVSAVLRLAPGADSLRSRIAGHASTSVGVHGSLARHLGLLAHVTGDWHGAASYFDVALEANRAAGAPVLVAHTCRHYSAVLRLRGGDGDWDRAVELLAQAADIYRRLEIDTRAEETEAILRRSLDSDDAENRPPVGGSRCFHRIAGGWALNYAGQAVEVSGSAGLGHIADLLAAPGRPLHVADMVGSPTEGTLRDQLVAECRSRLLSLADQPASDPVAVALALAERERLETELALLTDDASPAGEIADRARRLVGIRIRAALERVDEALPELGGHLRRSVRTGTFCVYEPGDYSTGPMRTA